MLKSSVHLLSFLHILPRPPLASVTYFLLHTLKISSLQAPADVHLMPLCLHYEYARFKLLFSWSHVGLKVGCLGSFPMRKMHFVPPDKAPSRREMVFSYPGICEAALPAFRASLPPSFFLREEHTYVVCTYGAFPPPPPPWSIECCIMFHSCHCSFHTCCFGFVGERGKAPLLWAY